ncbi:MAG: DUF488 domain-containing protein [Fusobacteriaceae bacterium]|jgi:uncharacterized protein (DUF488 family)|nr:DUF488 domain-containing protein [Fusobacteriaceae bacterium]
MNDKTVFSIGHSQHEPEYFLQLLKQHEINYVIDVRSHPYSEFAQNYNRENLKRFLEENGVHYYFMGDYFGARRPEKKLYTSEGYLDFDKVRQDEKFSQGKNNVIKGIENGNRIAFMCVEKDPLDCHRAILVTKSFHDAGINVRHILSDGSVQTQEELENRLLGKYFPKRQQKSLFDENNLSEEQYLINAYKRQNKEIGYSMDAEMEKRIG